MDIQEILKKRTTAQKYQEAHMFVQENMIGKMFDAPRGYGHATYRVIGGHADWKTTRDAKKLYAYIDEETGEWKFQYRPSACLCIAVVREGGYNGPAKQVFQEVFEPVKNFLTT